MLHAFKKNCFCWLCDTVNLSCKLFFMKIKNGLLHRQNTWHSWSVQLYTAVFMFYHFLQLSLFWLSSLFTEFTLVAFFYIFRHWGLFCFTVSEQWKYFMFAWKWLLIWMSIVMQIPLSVHRNPVVMVDVPVQPVPLPNQPILNVPLVKQVVLLL